MKFPKPFLVAFITTGLLLFACAWFPRLPEIALLIGIAVAFLGGFVALAIQVGSEFTGRRNLKIAGCVLMGVMLLIAALGWTLDILPYIWNGFALLFLGVAVLLLGAGVAWQCGRDYFEMFLQRHSPASPANWHALEEGKLPASSAGTSAQSKERFAHSYGVNITCTPRAGAMGLISHPLRMDE